MCVRWTDDNEMATTTMKPLLRVCDLQKDVIYTIQKKKTSIGPYCEIELEDVRIKIPIYIDTFQKDFLRYTSGGQTLEFLRPTCMYCFCEEVCEHCGCPMGEPCMCTFEFENIVSYEFDRYIEKIDELLDNPNIWCWGCRKYVWDWDLNHLDCGVYIDF